MRSILVVPLLKAAVFDTKNLPKFTAFYAPSFFLFDEQFLKNLYDVLEKFNDLIELYTLGFRNKKLLKFRMEECRSSSCI